MYEPALQRAANRATEEEAGPLIEFHYITCKCERCEAVREERKENNGK